MNFLKKTVIKSRIFKDNSNNNSYLNRKISTNNKVDIKKLKEENNYIKTKENKVINKLEKYKKLQITHKNNKTITDMYNKIINNTTETELNITNYNYNKTTTKEIMLSNKYISTGIKKENKNNIFTVTNNYSFTPLKNNNKNNITDIITNKSYNKFKIIKEKLNFNKSEVNIKTNKSKLQLINLLNNKLKKHKFNFLNKKTIHEYHKKSDNVENNLTIFDNKNKNKDEKLVNKMFIQSLFYYNYYKRIKLTYLKLYNIAIDNKRAINKVKIKVKTKKYRPNKPEYRDCGTIALYKSCLILIGGISSHSISSIYKYHLNNKYWEKIDFDSNIFSIYGHTIQIINGILFVILGFKINLKNEINIINPFDLILYDINTNTIIKKVSAVKESLFRKFHISELLGNNIIVFGGLDYKDTALNDSYMLNIKTFKWRRVNTNSKIYYPDGVYNHKSVVFQNIIYLFGGKSNFDYINNNVYTIMFDPNNDTCTINLVKTKGIPPCRRIKHSMNIIESINSITIFGGKSNNFEKILNDLYLFNINLNLWVQITSPIMPLHRSNHCSVMQNDKLIIMGGYNKYNEANNEIEKITFIFENIDLFKNNYF